MSCSRQATTRSPRLATGLSYGILSALDSEQRKAAEILAGQVLVHGGPGCGKTRTITHRIAHLVTSKTAKPEECLALTSTQFACTQMRERLKKLLGKTAETIAIHTFQSFGLLVLKDHREEARLPRAFRLAGSKEQLDFVTKALGWSAPRAQLAMTKLTVLKRRCAAPEGRSDESSLAELFEEWREHGGWLSEEDLTGLTAKLFTENAEVTAVYRARYPFLTIDEYQDIDSLGHRLVRGLVSTEGNLCVAGDSNQAIFCSQGTDHRFLASLEKDYPFAHKVTLRRNYRCGESILAAISKIMPAEGSSQRDRDASAAGEEGRVVVFRAGTDRAEIEYVTRMIAQWQRTSQYPLTDIAILYATSEQARMLEEAFRQSKIPWQYFLHETINAEAPVRGQGVFLLPRDGFKGLEFHTLFVMGCEKGLVPHFGDAVSEEPWRDEESRIFYAGLSRAREQLILTCAAKRRHGDEIRELPPSPPVKTIERYLLKHQSTKAAQGSSLGSSTQLDLF